MACVFPLPIMASITVIAIANPSHDFLKLIFLSIGCVAHSRPCSFLDAIAGCLIRPTCDSQIWIRFFPVYRRYSPQIYSLIPRRSKILLSGLLCAPVLVASNHLPMQKNKTSTHNLLNRKRVLVCTSVTRAGENIPAKTITNTYTNIHQTNPTELLICNWVYHTYLSLYIQFWYIHYSW